MGSICFYGCFETKTTCTYCKGPLILNGPFEKVTCRACKNEVRIDKDLYASIMKDLIEEYDHLDEKQGQKGMINFHFDYGAYKLDPRCGNCEAKIDVSEVETGKIGSTPCLQCGKSMSTEPSPEWLKKMVSLAAQLFNVAPRKSENTETITEQRPIVMTCPQCGGALRITSDRTRTADCDYCSSDVYLPDEVWKRLHPVETVREWFVRFEKQLQKDLEP